MVQSNNMFSTAATMSIAIGIGPTEQEIGTFV